MNVLRLSEREEILTNFSTGNHSSGQADFRKGDAAQSRQAEPIIERFSDPGLHGMAHTKPRSHEGGILRNWLLPLFFSPLWLCGLWLCVSPNYNGSEVRENFDERPSTLRTRRNSHEFLYGKPFERSD